MAAPAAMAQLAPPAGAPLTNTSSQLLRSRTSISAQQPLALPVLAWAVWRPARVVHARATKEERREEQQQQEGEETKEQVVSHKSESDDAETVTRKFGLEAGLWKILQSKGDEEGEAGKGTKSNQAKELLKRYGGAYLATSISLSLVSFALCYVLVQAGVDVPSLLEKVGIHVNETGEKVGTFALAYAAHKALSPVRFPPTVALTPIVASWFGKKPNDEGTSQ